MNNKKAQIQMFENIGVLVVFFFLLALGIVLYFNYQSKSIADYQKKISELKAFHLSQQLYNMPELDCHYGGIRINGCIDDLKLQIFSQQIQANKEDYFDILGFSEIKIKQVYPQSQEFVLYEEKPQNKYTSRVFTIPVILFSQKENSHCAGQLGSCSLALMEVTYYAPQ